MVKQTIEPSATLLIWAGKSGLESSSGRKGWMENPEQLSLTGYPYFGFYRFLGCELFDSFAGWYRLIGSKKNNPDVKSGLFLKNPSIAGVFKIKMVKLFFHRYINQ
ncbi:MAG: hypothetical protein R2830_27415 [Saprospiraceae bacterium]|nr:hypothetical protein [Saprospiraceae bacterium]